jgi:O-antigen/teichoic acid export membrane protein
MVTGVIMPQLISKDNYKKDIKATILSQLFRVVAGPLLLLFIPIYLTPVEQGYWYTFTGLAALAIFADLGFSNIILQFSAHEFAFLEFDNRGFIIGDKRHLLNLASFFRFAIKWLIKTAGIVFPIILIFGYCFLKTKGTQITWENAWLIYSLASAVAFVNSILLSFFEGCNSVYVIQSIKIKIAITNVFLSLVCLYLNFNLYALAISLAISTIIGMILIYLKFNKTIKQLWNLSKKDCFNWKPKFLSLIWRYAISWCSGYLIFQLFTPIAFKYHGAEFAGKLGISISMWTAGFGIAMSWLNAIIPKLNMLVELCEWKILDNIFHKSLSKALFTMILGGGIFLICQFFLEGRISFFNRVLNLQEMSLLFICWVGQVYINAIAVYLRGHKKEPLMLISVIVAIYVVITTLICAKFLESRYMLLGFASSLLFWIPTVYYIYKKEKKYHYTEKEKFSNE